MIQKVKEFKKDYLPIIWSSKPTNYIEKDIEIMKIFLSLEKQYCPYCGNYGKGNCCEE